MIISLQRRQLHGEVLAGVSRLVAVADAAATRQADEELEATAATRRAAWVQAVAALTSQRAAAEQARAAHKTLLSPRTCEPACEVVMPRLQVCLRGCSSSPQLLLWDKSVVHRSKQMAQAYSIRVIYQDGLF